MKPGGNDVPVGDVEDRKPGGAVVFGLTFVSMPVLRYVTRGRLQRVERSIAANRQLLDAP